LVLVVSAESLVLLILVVLVAGLLRSHADILRLLHDHGIVPDEEPAPVPPGASVPVPAPAMTRPSSAAVSVPAPDVAGLSPEGEMVAVGVGARPTMLAFLSSGCGTCAAFWARLADGAEEELEPFRVVVVTMDAARESESALRQLRPAHLPVVMSAEGWEAYDVPGSPYFVAVEGGVVRGQGTASTWDQLISLVRQAAADATLPALTGRNTTRQREERADAELAAAGIRPGDPRLYPTTPVSRPPS
jgi:hypothetical protein